jgi:hypothetical protein
MVAAAGDEQDEDEHDDDEGDQAERLHPPWGTGRRFDVRRGADLVAPSAGRVRRRGQVSHEDVPLLRVVMNSGCNHSFARHGVAVKSMASLMRRGVS